jgi:plasmid stability protein
VRHHPAADLLSRFLGGETTRAETREIVRHLLTGCPECRAFTSAAWRGPAARSNHRRTERMTALDLARKQIGRVIETLQAIRYQLIGIQASIPPTRQETSPEDLGSDPDAPTEIRSILANAVQDSLDPLIRDLDAAAGYEPRPAPE